jgi:hypothetical protein
MASFLSSLRPSSGWLAQSDLQLPADPAVSAAVLRSSLADLRDLVMRSRSPQHVGCLFDRELLLTAAAERRTEPLVGISIG